MENEKNFTPVTIDTDVFATVSPDDEKTMIRDSTTTDTATLFNAVNGASAKVSENLGNILNIANIVITSAKISKEYAERENPDAEKVSKPCAHFFTTDGKHIASVSNGIIRSVKMLMSCGLVPTPENPIPIIFTEINTKNGKSYTFELVPTSTM